MLYYKTEGNKTVFSKCSGMAAEEIAAAGWLVYDAPVPVYPREEPDYIEIMEAVKRVLRAQAEELTDEEALEVAALYPTWASQIGNELAAGSRLWYDGRLWKVLQAHTVQDDWRPDVAVSLYVEVSIEEWPEWRQPVGAHDAYNAGDQVSHNGGHWRSDCDGNIWEPGVFGWDEV